MTGSAGRSRRRGAAAGAIVAAALALGPGPRDGPGAGELGRRRGDRICVAAGSRQLVLEPTHRGDRTLSLAGQVLLSGTETAPVHGSARLRADGGLEFLLTGTRPNLGAGAHIVLSGRLAAPDFQSGTVWFQVVGGAPFGQPAVGIPCPATLPDAP